MAEPVKRPAWWAELGQVAVVAVLGGALGLAVGWVLGLWFGGAPVPRGAWLLLLGLAIGVAGFAFVAHGRIQRRRERVEPQLAVLWLGLARTALYGGAALAGFFSSWFNDFLRRSQATPFQTERGLHSGFAMLAAAALAVAGWFLQRALRVPPPRDEDAPR